ncbi:MAG: hypothetical protein JSR90_04475 [Proteobacteria bacterium]|nr:hypothetical protein [Pseudomonadota bacterium]
MLQTVCAALMMITTFAEANALLQWSRQTDPVPAATVDANAALSRSANAIRS